jgi:hypothetical protein
MCLQVKQQVLFCVDHPLVLAAVAYVGPLLGTEQSETIAMRLWWRILFRKMQKIYPP